MPCHSRLGNIEGEKGGKRKRREWVANHGGYPWWEKKEKGERRGCMGKIRREPGMVGRSKSLLLI